MMKWTLELDNSIYQQPLHMVNKNNVHKMTYTIHFFIIHYIVKYTYNANIQTSEYVIAVL